jgi:hypothetical protein
MELLGHEYNPDQWRLFSDSSKVRLKVVLLHSGNRFPSVPLAHAANMKESYEIIWESLSMKNLSGSYVVISKLLGMQLGYTKYCRFLCEWDSWDKKNQNVHINKLWPK